jgi:hypothetical protein
VHDAARAAVDARWAASFTELIVEGLRGRLAGLASTALDEESLREAREALEEHYGEHPEARPSLALVVESAAQLEDHPAAARPDLIEAAVLDLGEDAFVEDVLAWVRGALATETQVVPTKARRVVLR